MSIARRTRPTRPTGDAPASGDLPPGSLDTSGHPGHPTDADAEFSGAAALPGTVNGQRAQRVAVLITGRSSFGRRTLQGVGMFARPVKRWIIRVGPASDEVLSSLEQWQPDGIIAHIATDEFARPLQAMNVPLINISNGLLRSDIVRVGVDDRAVGALVANYLLERGFTNFAFVGDVNKHYAMDRRDGFVGVLKEQGLTCHEYDCSQLADDRHRIWDWTSSAGDRRMGEWLAALPRPLGLLAYQDYIGMRVSDVCRQFDLKVPEEIALVGVDDDEMVCGLTDPPLSSVRSPMQQVGYRAAQVLDRMMAGKPAPRPTTTFPPLAVITRQSSDITATSDTEVARALRFIRENADRPIQVDDVMTVTTISRRSLEQRFRKVLNRTLLDEIHRVHFDQARRLLVETDLPISQIALDSGFGGVTRMNAVFRKFTGDSPGEHRHRLRQR